MLELRLLGTFSLIIDGTVCPAPRSQSGANLLALLALRGGQPIEREWLAATLWPDSNGDQSRYNVRRNLTDLRHLLHSESARLKSPTPRSVSLDLQGAFCDVNAFDIAIAQKRWEQAISLYSGPLLSRETGAWVVGERDRREIDYLRALEALAGRAIEQEQMDEAIDYLRRILIQVPGRETAVRDLMRSLSAVGNRSEALLVYRNLRLFLHEQLLGHPSSETTDLFESLRSPARGAPKSAPPPSQPSKPLTLTSFFGREPELRQIVQLLERYRWLTLFGLGGIGKTRLAREVMRDWAGTTAFIDLSPLKNADLLYGVIQYALGVPQDETITRHIGDSKTLLIFDNCEHLPIPVVEMIVNLLAECPHLRILATSREPLGGSGEALLRIAPLEEEPSWQLFSDRVLASSPNYPMNHKLQQLCSSLDGWPLALELAAAQIRSLPLEEIQKRLPLLTASRTQFPDRQRSLQATLDWSWDLLSPAQRQGVCRLTCFAGSWDLDAAEAICSLLVETQVALVEKSLVEFDRERYTFREPVRKYVNEKWTDLSDKELTRQRLAEYFIHLCQDLESKLEGPDAQQTRLRIAQERENLRSVLMDGGEVALELACTLTMHWFRDDQGREGQYWLERLLAEHTDTDLLRARTVRCLGVLDASRCLWSIAQIRAEEAVALCEQIDSSGTNAAVATERLAATALLASTFNNSGQHVRARETYQEVLSVHRANGNSAGVAQALEDLGYAARNLGDFVDAEKYLQEARTLYVRQGNLNRAVSSLGQLAMVYSGRGDLPGARALMQETFASYEQLNQKQSAAWALCCLGAMERQLGDLTAAREHISVALEQYQHTGSGLYWPLLELGRVMQLQGDYPEARKILQQARSEAVQNGVESVLRDIDHELSCLPESDTNDRNQE